jgi:hypothetical protein
MSAGEMLDECNSSDAFSALFSLEYKNRFSFRARSKREMGLEHTRLAACEQLIPSKR